jgi:hypothetical protein
VSKYVSRFCYRGCFLNTTKHHRHLVYAFQPADLPKMGEFLPAYGLCCCEIYQSREAHKFAAYNVLPKLQPLSCRDQDSARFTSCTHVEVNCFQATIRMTSSNILWRSYLFYSHGQFCCRLLWGVNNAVASLNN